MAVEVSVLLDDSKLHTLVFADADAYEDQGDRLVVTAQGVEQASFRVWAWAMLIADDEFDEDEGDVPPDGLEDDEDDDEEDDEDEDDVTQTETVNLPEQDVSLLVPVSASYDHDDIPGSNGASAGETQGQPE